MANVLMSEKCRLCRASGGKLFLKGERCFTKCPIDRRGAVPPGQHGAKRHQKPSDYGLRLAEKQKLKRSYNVLEKELKKYFLEARKVPGATGEALMQILETRLDNLVYRLGFATSRRFARQLVSHKHILLEGQKVNVPSVRVKPGQVVALTEEALKIPEVKKALEKKDFKVPNWLERKAAVGKLVRLPKREEIESPVNEQLIVEYYSR